MASVGELVRMIAKQLSAEERRELRRELDALEQPEPVRPCPPSRAVSEEERLQAMKEFLDLGGTLHSDHTDVSSDPCKHLGDVAWERNHRS